MKRFVSAFVLGLVLSFAPGLMQAISPVLATTVLPPAQIPSHIGGLGEFIQNLPASMIPSSEASSHTYIVPTQGVLTSRFGQRWGRMHQGIDIGAPTGTPIVASSGGTVEFAGQKSGYGNVIDIRHSNGSTTRYAHNSRHLVRAGESVEQGQQIALVGATGRATGPHLHFELRLAGRGAVDPIVFLPSRQVQALRTSNRS